MRIGIVLANTPGYSETFFTSKIKGLQAHGITVHLFVRKRAMDFALCPVHTAPKVFRFSLFQLVAMMGTFLSLIPKTSAVHAFVKLERAEGTSISSLFKKVYLNAHLLKANVDWVHFGFATQAIGSECVAKAIGAKMAVSFRGFDINVYPLKFPKYYDTLWKYVDKVHSISMYLYKKGVGLGLPEETAYKIVFPAVAFQQLPRINPGKNDVFKIVTIARLNWIKGLDVAITAMKELKDRGVSFQYYIIGDGTTKEMERYQFQVVELGLSDTIHFCGKLTHHDTLEHVRQADLYIQPSLNEGFCNAVLEAQAMGKLVIASDVGGLQENIISESTGWLVPVGEPISLADKIGEVLALPQEKQQQIKKNAVTHVHSKFSIEKQQQAFVEFYTIDP